MIVSNPKYGLLHHRCWSAKSYASYSSLRSRLILSIKLACENIRFSSLFAAGDVSRGGTSATQGKKFHTDNADDALLRIEVNRLYRLITVVDHKLCSSRDTVNLLFVSLTSLLISFAVFLILCMLRNPYLC